MIAKQADINAKDILQVSTFENNRAFQNYSKINIVVSIIHVYMLAFFNLKFTDSSSEPKFNSRPVPIMQYRIILSGKQIQKQNKKR